MFMGWAPQQTLLTFLKGWSKTSTQTLLRPAYQTQALQEKHNSSATSVKHFLVPTSKNSDLSPPFVLRNAKYLLMKLIAHLYLTNEKAFNKTVLKLTALM